MITDFKIFPKMALKQVNFGTLSFNNYFMFMTNEKLHLFLYVIFIVA